MGHAMRRQIITVGGGQYYVLHLSSEASSTILLAQQSKTSPRIGLIHQASAEDPRYANLFYETCIDAGAEATGFSLSGSVQLDKFKAAISQQDVIFVDGGNTRSMLGLWKTWGVDI